MKIQKWIIAAVLGGSLTTAMAANDWKKVTFNNKTVNLYFDANSIKPRTDQYKNRYLDVRVNRAYGEPQRMSTGKFYTHYYETLSVDCSQGAYATSNSRWTINSNTEVHKSAGNKDDWNKYDDEDRTATAAQARAVCRYYKSFLG